jgi:rhamnulokinase
LTLTLAAVDLGAQSGRVATGRFDGQSLRIDEVHRFANEPLRTAGRLYWDVPALYAEAVAGLRAAASSGDIASVAVDSWAIDFGLIDADGGLLENPVHYRDARRAAAVREVLERIPPRELYGRTGIQLLPINTIFQLAAMASDADPALASADHLLLIPDLFHYWLCGTTSTELTNASTTQCLGVDEPAWTFDLLERLGVPTQIFPELVSPGTPLGTLSSAAAEATGLSGTQVVATATHDTAAAVAAVPMADDRCAYLSVGTWSLVGVESREPVSGDAAYAANVTNERGVEGTFRVLRNVTGLWLVHECRRAWASSGRDRSYDELVALAAEAPPLRSFIDPDDPMFAEPGDMAARVADFCSRTGQAVPDGDGPVVRCILESLALKQAETVDVLAGVTGRALDVLHVVGGGASNRLLCAWTAEAAGRPVHAGPVEATLAGNLLVQAMALGEIGSVAEGREIVRRSFAPTLYEPTGDPAWAEARERFAALSENEVALEVRT